MSLLTPVTASECVEPRTVDTVAVDDDDDDDDFLFLCHEIPPKTIAISNTAPPMLPITIPAICPPLSCELEGADVNNVTPVFEYDSFQSNESSGVATITFWNDPETNASVLINCNVRGTVDVFVADMTIITEPASIASPTILKGT